MLKAVVFDLDGTIADTLPLTIYALKEVTRELTGKQLSDEDIIKEFGPTDTRIIKKLVDNENSEQSIDKYIECFKKNFNEYVKPIEGIEELLKTLKNKGIKTGLFTGRSMLAAKIILQTLKLEQYFDEIFAGDNTTKPKPDPEGIIMTLKKLGVKESDSAYAGDFDVDIAASKAAGVTSILVLWSSTKSDELIKMNPDKYFRSTKEFIDWVREM